MNNTKLKFKKENEKPKLRDSIIFMLIIVLCAVTFVTIQLRSKNKKSETMNSQHVENTSSENNILPEEESTVMTNAELPIDEEPELIEAETYDAKEELNEDAAISESYEEAVEVVTEQKPLEFISPVSGQIIKDYSEIQLVYSKTMDDWRPHLGVDIAADLGTDVISCEEGTVEKIYDDEQNGKTVAVKHGEYILTIYSNLAEKLDVHEGDSVSRGQKIGVVGDSALYEILDEPHLHFEMSDGGILVNPQLHIEF